MAVQDLKSTSTAGGRSVNLRTTWIITLLFLLTAVNFVDRMVISSVGPVLRTVLHFSNTQYSFIVFAFMLGMTLGQVPIGILIDRVGVRVGLPATLVGWSIANMLQAAARSVAGFSGPRFIMGLCECGTISGAVKAVAEVLPSEFRAVALGVVNTGFLLGSVIAPPVTVLIIEHFGWRAAFLLPSVVGMLWVIPWARTFRREPATGSGLATTEGGPKIRSLLGISQTWGVILMRGTAGPLSQFYWYWLPLYLVRGRGATMGTMAKWASIAYLVGGSGNVIGGYLSGLLIKHGVSVDRSRKLTFTAGAVLCALCTFLVPCMFSLKGAVLLVAMAFFGNNVMACLFYSIASDVFPESTLARVIGLTGVGEGIVSMTLTLLTGVIVDRFLFKPVFFSASALPLVSIAALFLLVHRCELVSSENWRVETD